MEPQRAGVRRSHHSIGEQRLRMPLQAMPAAYTERESDGAQSKAQCGQACHQTMVCTGRPINDTNV
jgi:hypothetical protein